MPTVKPITSLPESTNPIRVEIPEDNPFVDSNYLEVQYVKKPYASDEDKIQFWIHAKKVPMEKDEQEDEDLFKFEIGEDLMELLSLINDNATITIDYAENPQVLGGEYDKIDDNPDDKNVGEWKDELILSGNEGISGDIGTKNLFKTYKYEGVKYLDYADNPVIRDIEYDRQTAKLINRSIMLLATDESDGTNKSGITDTSEYWNDKPEEYSLVDDTSSFWKMKVYVDGEILKDNSSTTIIEISDNLGLLLELIKKNDVNFVLLDYVNDAIISGGEY